MFSRILLVLSCVLLNSQTQAQEGGRKRSPEQLERTDRKPKFRKGSRITDQVFRGGTAIDGPIDLIWVEAGSFMMGSPENEAKRLGYNELKTNEVISVLTTALPQLGRSRKKRH